MYRKHFKRIIDIILSAVAIMVLSPVILLTAILVRINLGTPVIFVQERPGKDEKIFRLFKFRTMTSKTDENGILLPDEMRLTTFGRILRKTSLDELPELLNCLRGDMSIVGPRPLLTRYLPYYTPEERRRHCVRPGLTGLAQVSGRNALAWDKRLALDVDYVNRITFFRDVEIIFKTVVKVIRREDIIDAGHFSMLNLDEERGEKFGDSSIESGGFSTMETDDFSTSV